MALNFLKRKEIDLVDAYAAGFFICSGCRKQVDLEGFSPLEMGRCPSCESPNFIPQCINRFWLNYPLGGGGMGAVYKAIHEDYPDVAFAVKILPRGQKDNSELIQNLQIEAEIMANLGSHPCIVSGIENGYEDGEHYLASEYIEGERLDKRIERLGTLPEFEVLLIALRLLSAESHIFNQGYLFRDLKPENILINKHNGAFLYDYGICIEVDKAMNNPDDIIEGSPFYMPPERVTGGGEGPYSEIYSLGMILYHALAGKTYFSAKELKQLARQLMRTVRLSNIEGKLKSINPDIAVIIDKMIKREPERRYQTYVEVERDILQILRTRF